MMNMSFPILRRVFVLVCIVLLMGANTSVFATDEVVSPEKVIDSVANQVLLDLNKNREIYRKDFVRLRQMIDKYMLTYFDTEYAAQLVLAKNWRTASVEQRKQFIDAFYQSLLLDYGNSLLEFTDDRLKIFPFQGKASDSTATVRSEIRRDNGSKVSVNYTMRLTEAGWKVYDVTIEGVSYIKSFRTDFATEIEQKGLDAVIKRLQTQQHASPIAKKQSS